MCVCSVPFPLSVSSAFHTFHTMAQAHARSHPHVEVLGSGKEATTRVRRPGASLVELRLMKQAAQLGALSAWRSMPAAPAGCLLVDSAAVALLGRGMANGAAGVSALQQAVGEARALYADADERLRRATAYLTLEPAQGSSDAALLLQLGCARVVLALLCPEPGQGGVVAAALRAAGAQVDVGVGAVHVRATLYPYLYSVAHSAPLTCLATRTRVERAETDAALRTALAAVVARFRFHCADDAGALLLDARCDGAGASYEGAPPAQAQQGVQQLLSLLCAQLSATQVGTGGRGEQTIPPWLVVLDAAADVTWDGAVRAAAAAGRVRVAWVVGEQAYQARLQREGADGASAVRFPGTGIVACPVALQQQQQHQSSSNSSSDSLSWPSVLSLLHSMHVRHLWLDEGLLTGRLVHALRQRNALDCQLVWRAADKPDKDRRVLLSDALRALLENGDDEEGSEADEATDGASAQHLVEATSPVREPGAVYGALPKFARADAASVKIDTIIPGAAPRLAAHLQDERPIFFRTGDDHFGFLSNFSPDAVTLRERCWPTVEHYYQAAKFFGVGGAGSATPEQQAAADAIWRADGPLQAKNLSRTHAAHVRADWEQSKRDVMDEALRAKFSAPQLLRQLLATGDRLLVEYSDMDDYWGSDYSLMGRNVLGQLLMRIRGESNAVVSRARLPCEFGAGFRIVAFADSQHVALVHDGGADAAPLDLSGPVLTRLHSECLTGDVFGSQRCDCGGQLHAAMDFIRQSGSGVLLYLRQEGRGIGISNKVRAYALQERGFDTVDANEILGFPNDMRCFSEAAAMLRTLGVKQVRLITNNPCKRDYLRSYGVPVTETVSLPSRVFAASKAYLDTKNARMGHSIRTYADGGLAFSPSPSGDSSASPQSYPLQHGQTDLCGSPPPPSAEQASDECNALNADGKAA